MNSTRSIMILLSLVAALGGGGREASALGIGADPDELVRIPTLRLQGRIIAIGWKTHARELPPRPLPRALDLSEIELRAPAGATDAVLVLDGPLTLSGVGPDGARFHRELKLDELVLPLADPDAAGPLALSLPEITGQESSAALQALLRDGALLVPAP